MTLKDRYAGIQSILKVCGESGCHFLVLLSIAEEYSQKDIDLIYAIRVCQSKGWLRSDFYVTDALSILYFFTNKKWERSNLVEVLPEIKANQYTEVKWVRDVNETHYEHFTRRKLDTWANSQTVKYGKILGYYIYTCKE